MDGPCPSDNRIVAYVDGELADADLAELEHHFDGCPSCTELLAGLAQPASTAGASGAPLAVLPAGTVVDRYVVRGRLGAGAMGVVYEAFDPELKRRVAIKIVRSDAVGTSSRDQARALREAQAMARLSHPNLVPVLAVGTRGDDLYLVMELVLGTTMRAWLAATPRSWRAVVQAYVAAGRGLAAANTAGVVHRDFKPDNVLIDHGGAVRVIDFGLARVVVDDVVHSEPAIGAPEQDAERTGVGVVVGTPAYMPPEQLRDAGVDARADQFALAVSLWEGLFGARPFVARSRKALLDAIEHQRVHRPKRTSVPTRLRRVLLRALSPRPEQRFASMDAFVDAIERGTSVAARRVGLAAGVLAVAGAALLIVPRADECTPESAPRWDSDARARLRDVFASARRTSGATGTSVEAALDRRVDAWHETAARVCAARDQRDSAAASVCLDMRRLELDVAIDVILEGDAPVLTRALEVVARLPAVETCATASDPRLALVDPASGVEEARVLRTELARARSLGDAGRFVEAIAIAQGVVTRAEAIGHAPLHAEAECRLGALHAVSGDKHQAIGVLESAYFAAREIGHDEVATEAALLLAQTLGVGLVRIEAGREWLAHAQAALDRWSSREAEAELTRIRGAIALRAGEVDTALREHARAVELWRAAVDGDDPRLALAIDMLGSAHYEAKDWPAALAQHERALEMRERLFGDSHPSIAFSLNSVAMDLVELGEPEAAIQTYEWGIEIGETMLGPEHVQVGVQYNNLGAVWGRLDEPGAAAQAFERALPGYRTLGLDHPDYGMLLANLGNARLAYGDVDGAIDVLGPSLAIYERRLGPEHPDTRESAATLGRAMYEAGARRRAIALLEQALLGDGTPDAYPPSGLAILWTDLGLARREQGDTAGARAALARAREQLALEPADDIVDYVDELARALPPG